MPKKKSKNKSEKEKILDEIAVSLISVQNEESERDNMDLSNDKSEESGLEEDVELNLLDMGFHQFMQPSENVRAPILERIAGEQPKPIFVGGIPQGPATNLITEEKDDFKYFSGGNNTNEPKYLGSDSHISAETRPINILDAGRRHNIMPEVNQQAFFERASETKNFQSENVERFERTERFDTERAGRKDPFEKDNVKYEKYRPKLPKSW
mgnify:FL=1